MRSGDGVCCDCPRDNLSAGSELRPEDLKKAAALLSQSNFALIRCGKLRGSDRAPQDSRLRSQKGGVEFINFPSGSFRSEICSEQLDSCSNPGSNPKDAMPIDVQALNSRIAKSHF